MKDCKSCLHHKVCAIVIEFDRMDTEFNRKMLRISRGAISQVGGTFAEQCENYLVHKKGSVENFIEDVASAQNVLSWCADMMAKRTKNGKNTRIVEEYVNEGNTKWLDDYHATLMRGSDTLQGIIDAIENESKQ